MTPKPRTWFISLLVCDQSLIISPALRRRGVGGGLVVFKKKKKKREKFRCIFLQYCFSLMGSDWVARCGIDAKPRWGLYQHTPEICSSQFYSLGWEILSSTLPFPVILSLPGANSGHTPAREHEVQWLEPVKAKCILCGGVSKDHVWVVEHVQAIECQWVDFEIVQWELGVDIKADICGQRACQVLRQAGRRLSTHCTEARQQNH